MVLYGMYDVLRADNSGIVALAGVNDSNMTVQEESAADDAADDAVWAERARHREDGVRAGKRSAAYLDLQALRTAGDIGDGYPMPLTPEITRGQSKRTWERTLAQWRRQVKDVRADVSMIVALQNLGVHLRVQRSGPYTIADGNRMLEPIGKALVPPAGTELPNGKYLMFQPMFNHYRAVIVGTGVIQVDGNTHVRNG